MNYAQLFPCVLSVTPSGSINNSTRSDVIHIWRLVQKLHCVSKKCSWLLVTTSANVDRFLTYFHWQICKDTLCNCCRVFLFNLSALLHRLEKLENYNCWWFQWRTKMYGFVWTCLTVSLLIRCWWSEGRSFLMVTNIWAICCAKQPCYATVNRPIIIFIIIFCFALLSYYFLCCTAVLMTK